MIANPAYKKARPDEVVAKLRCVTKKTIGSVFPHLANVIQRLELQFDFFFKRTESFLDMINVVLPGLLEQNLSTSSLQIMLTQVQVFHDVVKKEYWLTKYGSMQCYHEALNHGYFQTRDGLDRRGDKESRSGSYTVCSVDGFDYEFKRLLKKAR